MRKKISISAAGFTLIEVLIAITILAAMSLAMFGASTQMITSKERTEVQDEANHSVGFALNKMAEDLSMAYIVKNQDMLGPRFEGEIGFQGTENRLDFVTFGHLRYIKNSKESDSVEVSYYLDRDPDDPETRRLMRRESTQVDRLPQEGGQAYELLKGIRELRLAYLPEKSEEWKTVWDTQSVDSGNKLPRAVQIEIEVKLPEEEEPQRYSTLVPIRLRDPLAF